MWIASTSGWFSVVVDQQRDGFMLIRARCGVDIANLYREHHEGLPSMTEPVSDELRDYRWRLSVSKDDWVRLAGRLAEQVSYGNFKSAVHDRKDQGNKSLAYGRIWQTMMDVQRDEQGKPAVSERDQWQAWIDKLDKQSTSQRSEVVPKPKRKASKRAKKLF